ncbi:Uncharacterized conserved protein YndB, AHSA1/START domain [Rhizobiales bacterium GAS188]|nr:Uncharacterized conserved protein YndB, AHSA1/START domain [Rhizobiales bacterium GAS188]
MSDAPRDAERSVTFECEFDEPPEKVWRALTVPELVSAWLMPNDMRPEVGGRFTMKPERAGEGDIACEVLTAEPHRLLRYRWREAQTDRDGQDRRLDSVVTFVLSETPAGGTHLRLVHSGLERREQRPLTVEARAQALGQPMRRHAVRHQSRRHSAARRGMPIMASRAARPATQGRLRWAA